MKTKTFELAMEEIEGMTQLLRVGTVTLDLSHAATPYTARWYNPRTGETAPASVAPDGGQTPFSSPTSGPGKDWVLHVHSRS